VKAALHALGIVRPEVRLPLLWPSDESVRKILAVLSRFAALGSAARG
jgi:dihydrodipicolinate synthase/N-acetylneuraminate lyase